LGGTAKKHLDFEKDQDLQRWLRNVRRGSPVHAEIVRRQLGRLCELLSTTPEGMVEQANSDMKRFQDSLDPQKLRATSETAKFRNKLVREKELERYLNSGWEMVQTVNSRILIRKQV
jgi:hypothetical protein